MFLPRIIPVLLLRGKGLVKTIKFKNPRYIGDPINAVRIFNNLKADELAFLDITASSEGRSISADIVQAIGDEAYMPFAVGGGIDSVDKIEQVLKAGAEKVIINTQAVLNPGLVNESAKIFGSQSIVVSIDVKKSLLGKYEVWIRDGSINSQKNPIIWARDVEALGAGEILLNSIDLDGTFKGYDVSLIQSIASSVKIPVVACGGAGQMQDLGSAYFKGNAHALAAGSIFVYHGPRHAVLINYPSKDEIKQIFSIDA